MNRAQRDLEKAVKGILRGETGDPARVTQLWDELGVEGSRLLVRLLNRPGGWQAFCGSVGGFPGMRRLLDALILHPGISEEGIRALEQLGADPPSPDAPSRRALWIREAASRPDSGDWSRARDMLLADPGVLEGSLALMEAEPSAEVAAFLGGLHEQQLAPEADHLVRKTMYRLRQLGFDAPPARSEDRPSMEKEWWAFGENRDPNIQFVLCFRFHSTFSSSGDLYILRIWEGVEVFPLEQEAGVDMTRSRFLETCRLYSSHLTRQFGLEIPMTPVETPHAHSFLRRSLAAIPESGNPRVLSDFVRFLGAGEGEDPVASLPVASEGSGDLALLQHPYFMRWALNPEDLQDFFEKLKDLEQGTIVLVGSSQMEQKRAAAAQALSAYFDARRRALWSYAFAKAAYFLRKTDSQASAGAMQWAAMFREPSVDIERIAAAKLLFERAAQLQAAIDEREKKEARNTSLIVTPDEFARTDRNRGQ